MKIKSVTTSEHVGGILLPDLESVKAALVMFGQGTRGSNATNQRLISDGGGIASMMLTMVNNPGRFLEFLFKEMDATLESRDVYDRSFDYDGQGSFFKTSVTVSRLEGGSFMLSLNAAYVGKEVEVGLAEALDIHRGLWWNNVIITFEAPKGNEFKIDFDPIASKLASYAGHKLKGTEIAQKIAEGRQESYETKPSTGGHFLARMGSSEGPSIGISISSGSVGSYREHQYVQDGSSVIGALTTGWQDPKIKLDPVVVIDILGHREYGANYPVFDSVMQQKSRDTAALIVDRFTTP